MDTCHSISSTSPCSSLALDSIVSCHLPSLFPIPIPMMLPFPPSHHWHYLVFQIWRSVDFHGFQVTIIISRISALVHNLVSHSLAPGKLVYCFLQFHCKS